MVLVGNTIRFLCHCRQLHPSTCITDDTRENSTHAQGTVEEAALAAKTAAAQARATAAAADEQAAEALFADAQTSGGLPPSSPWASAFAADDLKVKARLAEARFADSLGDDGLVKESSGQQKMSEISGGAREQQLQQQQQQQLPQTAGAGVRVGVVGGAASAASAVSAAPAAPAASVSVATAREDASSSSLAERDNEKASVIPRTEAPKRQATVVRHTAIKAVTSVPEVTSRLKTSDREAPPLARKMGGTVKEGGGSSSTGKPKNIANGRGEGLGTRSDPESAVENRAENGNVVSGAAAEVDQQQEQDWASMTVVALKDELRQRGLKVSGKKAELVERLLRA